ncbi:MAG: hypothetical protein L6R36_004168 [Xanthoria steineri]|nr:MAG: hypothetical protein L6R36_004168 [Xanthoria steineri]
MGLSSLNPFSSSSSSTTTTPSTPKPSADGAFIAPDRTSRAKCYEARDAFFHCLDKNGILDAIKDQEKARQGCGDVEKAFGRDCAGSWVTYFKQRRVMEWKKQQTLNKIEAEGGWVPEGAATPAASQPQMPK